MSANRFYFPEKFFRVRDTGTLMAYFSFVDNETGLEYSNWRLVSGNQGNFVSSPFETYEHPTEGTKYYNFVKTAYDKKQDSKRSPKGDAYLQDLADAAYAFYQKLQGGTPVAAGTGRGPVGNTNDDDDDLPF